VSTVEATIYVLKILDDDTVQIEVDVMKDYKYDATKTFTVKTDGCITLTVETEVTTNIE